MQVTIKSTIRIKQPSKATSKTKGNPKITTTSNKKTQI